MLYCMSDVQLGGDATDLEEKKSQLPACPRMNGKLDFPCLQIFKLKVLKTSKAPPETKLLNADGFLEKMKLISPPLRTIPPITD